MTEGLEQWSAFAPGAADQDATDRTIPRSRSSIGAPNRCAVRLDDGTELLIVGPTFIGRDPQALPAGSVGQLISLNDSMSSISKTHASLDVVDGVLRARDCRSTNGTFVRAGGIDEPLEVDTWRDLAVGDRVLLGDRWMEVVASEGAHRIPDATAAAVPSAFVAPSPPPAMATLAEVPATIGAGAPSIGEPCTSCGLPLEPGTRFCTTCGNPVVGAHPSVAAPAPERRSTRRPGVLIVGIAAAAVAAAVLVVVLRGGGEDAGSASATAPSIGAEPSERYTADVDVPEFGSVWATGPTSRLVVVTTDWETESSVTAFDDVGEILWESELDGSLARTQVVGGVILASFIEDDEVRLVRFDAETGDELWSDDLGDDESWELIGDRLYRYDDDTIELRSLDDGSSEARISVASAGGAMSSLRRTGFAVGYDAEDGEAQVFDAGLDEITAVIDVGDASAVAYAAGRLVAIEDDELRGYDHDGNEVFAVRSPLDPLTSIRSLGGSRWLVSDGEEVAALEVNADGADELWSADGSIETVFTSSGSAIVVVFDDGDYRFLDGSNGDELDERSADGSFVTAANGFLYFDEDGEMEAVLLPSGDVAWTAKANDGYITPVEDGYVIVDQSDDEATLEVYGS